MIIYSMIIYTLEDLKRRFRNNYNEKYINSFYYVL